MNRILVWDLPVRVGHWLLVGGFVIAWLTSESESLRLLHVLAGATVLGVIVFRLFWGIAGTRHARFASFVRGPAAIVAYLRSLISGHPAPTTGHNPAGAIAIVALLVLGLLASASGWLTYQDIGGHWVEELHEGFAQAMLGVVIIHLAGIAVGSLAHRENLVRAMFTGRKSGKPEEAISGTRPLAAIFLISWAALAAWLLAR